MRRLTIVLALLLAPAPLLAYVVDCGFGRNDSKPGPVALQTSMWASGTSLHYQTEDFLASVGIGVWSKPVLGVPTVSILGNQIAITQTYVPPMPASTGFTARQFCQSEDVNIGTLAPGKYNVSWTYMTPAGPTTVTGAVVVTAGTTCTTSPTRRASNATITRTPAGTAHLHFESIEVGYNPVYGAPVLKGLSGDVINVEQPLTDTVNYEEPGAPPALLLCRADDLDLGVLPPGAWHVNWVHKATLAGAGPYAITNAASVIWSGTAALCTSYGLLSTLPSVPGNTGPVTLLVSYVTFRDPPTIEVRASVEGNVVAVNDEIDTEGPPAILPPPVLHCFTSAVTVPRLPIGDYAVPWQTNDLGWPVDLAVFHFRVAQGRRQTARR